MINFMIYFYKVSLDIENNLYFQLKGYVSLIFLFILLSVNRNKQQFYFPYNFILSKFWLYIL